MPHDQETEDRCNELKLDAPRVTVKSIEARVRSVTYTKLPSGKACVCEIILENGFSVTGIASAVSVKNYNQEIAEKVSKQKAYDAIWPLEGYLLQESVFTKETYAALRDKPSA